MLKRLEQLLFYGLFIAIPFQIRTILYYPGWRFNEWQAVAFWGTDIILIALLGLWLVQSIRKGTLSFIGINSYKAPGFWLIVFLALAAVSIKVAPLQYLAWYSWIRLLEFVLFFFYIKYYAVQKFEFSRAALALIAGGFFQGVLAITQFSLQRHIGFHWFGEGILNPLTPGTAVFYNFAGEKIMRAYGTTPHPNILAGYLLLCLFACYFIWCWYGTFFTDKRFRNIFYIGYGVVLFGFFLTFSRTAIFVWAIVSLSLYLWVRYREQSLYPFVKKLGIATLVTGVLFSGIYWKEVSSRLLISRSEEAVQLRIYFAGESVDQGIRWNGVGIGNFVKWLMIKNPGKPDWMYQPVHNIYLLLYSELGVVALSTFFLFMGLTLKKFWKENPVLTKRIFLMAMLTTILFIALFDHYFLTMQQGRFIWWLVLALL